ncbi:MAG: hypothetical protein EP343_13830 [Deltaproteobacteria bacterium]|nr:MAG: hypothetical protein EP343_13830 [Deltaproteobacteria bacterium]
MDYLTDEQVETLKQIMRDQQDRLVRAARNTMTEQYDNRDVVPADTIDLSSDESLQVTEHRLRDREKFLIAKIDKALKRMEAGTYGYCKECDDEIGFPRLKARPVAELCIDCKEEQEQFEKGTAKRRMQGDSVFP